MKTDQALQLLSQVVAQFRGTLEEHQTLQTALKAIEEALAEKVQPKK